MSNQTGVKDYTTAREYLEGGRDPERRSTEYETAIVRRDPETLAVQAWATDVVTYHPDGSVTLNSGGWLTQTTKRRINDYQDLAYVYQDRSVWYLTTRPFHWGASDSYVFQDGVRVAPDGTITYPGATEPAAPEGSTPESRDAAAERRQLAKDVAAYARDFAAALLAGEVHAPDGGDCWYCLMRTRPGNVPLGEALRNSEHLLSHIADAYYVPSLLVRALAVYGASDVVQHALWSLWQGTPLPKWGASILEDTARRALRKYIRSQVGLPV